MNNGFSCITATKVYTVAANSAGYNIVGDNHARLAVALAGGIYYSAKQAAGDLLPVVCTRHTVSE